MLIFFIQKRRKYIIFHAHKENSITGTYFIDGKIIFSIYSLSVSDIPGTSWTIYNFTIICIIEIKRFENQIYTWFWEQFILDVRMENYCIISLKSFLEKEKSNLEHKE